MKILIAFLLSLVIATPSFAEDFDDLYDEANLDETVTIQDEETNDTEETEEEVEEETEEYLSKNFYTIEMVRESQSAFNKYVPITIRITPNETPVKTQITWDVPDDVSLKTSHSEFIESLVKDQTYEFKARVKPSDPGTYEIVVNVTAWQHDTNYTSSESIQIEFNNNLVVDPTDTNYQVLNIVKIFLIILSIGGIGVGLYFGGKKLMEILGGYLKPPEI
jgi:hypothetical protein